MLGRLASTLRGAGGAAAAGTASKAGIAAALWTFPAILGSAIVISWGAEAAQFLISQGLALAILAWLQTLPEFAVEAVIAWEAGRDPAKVHLATANLTGSLRLLVGLGWPLIYLVAALAHRRRGQGPLREVVLDDSHAIEVVTLLPCLAYFSIVALKGTLSLWDSLWLTAIYVAYLWLLNRMPPEEEEDVSEIPPVPRAILRQAPRTRNAIIVGLFFAGGAALYLSAHPFLDSMLAMAAAFGISQFVFVQWIAPFLSEFPEYVSALKWSSQRKAPMALMNMVSSNINQWTMLAGMIPIAFCLSRRSTEPLVFDSLQEAEIALTLSTCLLGFLLLANMRFAWHEALLLGGLFVVQFWWEEVRVEVALLYWCWCVVLLASMVVRRQRFECIPIMRRVWAEHVSGR